MTKKATKRALLSSALALVVCISMLIGTTYAWFTDSVTSTNNIIKSGNLDVELYYQVEGQTDWTKVTNTTNIFKEDTLWEPGHTEVVKLKVVNEGTLALKYQLGVNIASEVGSTNAFDKEFKLSDYIKYGIVAGAQTYTRDQAVAAVDATATALKSAWNSGTVKLDAKNDGNTDENIVTMVVYMPTTVGNEANYAKGEAVPTINLGINLFATQFTAESDSFGTDYDAEAPAIEVANTAELQAALDNATLGTTIKLLPGQYGVVYVRPTANNDTTMYCETHDFETTDAEELKAHLNDGTWHTTPRYTTTINGLTVIGSEGATVAGFIATSGHAYGDVYDYVRDIDYDAGSAYYNTLYLNNITFKNVAFTGKIDINTSDADSIYNGVTFDGCSFTTGGTDSTNGAAIRYYNEANNGNVKNIVVKNSTFTNCYQGVYVHHVNTVTVTDNVFDTTGHNAIALQGIDVVNLKDVVIARNTFKNIADRIIRFNNVGADSNITIQDNVATNSGDEDGEVIKATSIAAGVTTSVKNNIWGAGAIVVNDELKDPVTKVSSVSELTKALAKGGNIELTNDITLANTLLANKNTVIDLNGKKITTTSNCMFQSQSNAAPTMIISNGEIDITDGDTSVLLGYGSTEIYGVTINLTNCDNKTPNPFKVYGDITLKNTVVNVDFLGTSLISNNGAVNIVIDGAEINIGTYKTNATAVIALNNASKLEMKNTELTISNFVRSTFGGESLVSKVDGVKLTNCTFDVTDSNGDPCTFEAKDGKYRLVLK